MSLEFEVECSIALQEASLEVSIYDLKEAYEEFAELYPTINELADLAMERQDKQVVKRMNSHFRAAGYSLVGLVASLLTTNVVGIVASSACLYSSLLAKAEKE